MMAQGVYLLMYLALLCNPQTKTCHYEQVFIDAYRNDQVCELMANRLAQKVPDTIFYCTQERNL